MAAPEGIGCRLMQPRDWPALLALWESTFRDAPRYASNCIDIFAGTENVLVAQNPEGLAIAMLLAVPCGIGAHRGVYLYALATRPDCRGRGVMAALMEESDSLASMRGAAFSVLIPATEKLYGYYRRHGYDETLYLRHLALDGVMSGGAADVKTEIPHAEKIVALRQRWMPYPTVAFSGPGAVLVASDLAETPAFVAEGEKGYALYCAVNGALLVAELAAESDAAAQDILATLQQATGCNTLRLTLPQASPLFAGQGAQKSAAVLKALDGDFRFDEATYLRFAMDEAFRFDLPGG